MKERLFLQVILLSLIAMSAIAYSSSPTCFEGVALGISEAKLSERIREDIITRSV